MPLIPYPVQLSDPAWKRYEKKTGIRATGVGKTLRDAEKAWVNLAKAVVALEQRRQIDAAKVEAHKQKLIIAFTAAQKAFEPLVQMETTAKISRVLGSYHWTARYLAKTLLVRLDFNDHRGLNWVVDVFNDRTTTAVKDLPT